MKTIVFRKFAFWALTAITFTLITGCNDPVNDDPPEPPPPDPFEQLYWNTLSTDWYDRNPSASEYIISTANELAGLVKLVNTGKGFSGKTITLANDINLGGKEWVPIGYTLQYGDYRSVNYVFNGVFNGNDKVISGLYISYAGAGTTQYGLPIGLFGVIDSGTVKNLGVVNVDITGDWGGGIVGSLRVGNVFNCYSSGAVSVVDGSVGGVVGGNGGNVTNCHFSGSVRGKNHVGGVVGYNGGKVTICYAEGTVDGDYYVGGVVGGVHKGNVANSYSTSVVNGNVCVGGVVGRTLLGGNITNCYNTGAVSGTTRIGGIVGFIGVESTVANCYSASTVSSSGDYSSDLNGVGGVVGSVITYFESREAGFGGETNVSVTNCAALNPIVKYTYYDPLGAYIFRVVGGSTGTGSNITLSNNIAFDGMVKEIDNGLSWLYDDGFGSGNANNANGADITAAEIRADGTIGGRFTVANGWTVENGKLPGIGATVDMPEHLK
jgi:hypothetical protein